MEWINYHHLLYFWMVAREGTIAQACQKLHVAQPTISAQLRRLERSMGQKLFKKSGRLLVLTEFGQTVFRYAEEIFSLGRELEDVVRERPVGRALRFVVGVADVVPKLIACRLLEPALKLKEPLQVVCTEGKPDRLLAELSTHSLDLVLTDSPVPHSVKVKAYSHLLGECDVTVFGTPALAAAHRRGFPRSLDGAPLLLPAAGTSLRRALDQWLDDENLRPEIRGEFDDSALLKAFGHSGLGLFVGPSAIEREIRGQYGVQVVGRIESVRERFYAVSVERRLKHPAVVAISNAARTKLFC